VDFAARDVLEHAAARLDRAGPGVLAREARNVAVAPARWQAASSATM
jgi:hypothetical protein